MQVQKEILLSHYIGLKYEKAGRGPETFDCWGLVRYFYQNEFGIELPLYPGVKHDARESLSDAISQEKSSGHWKEVLFPEPYDLLLMQDMARGWHVGLYVVENGNRALHICSGQTSCLEPIQSLVARGMKSLEYFKWSPQST